MAARWDGQVEFYDLEHLEMVGSYRLDEGTR